MDGSESPLYLEALFPYLYVEQKHGWSGIQARIPGYLRLREPGKRAVEFLLSLEAYQTILTRQRLMSVRSTIESDWKATANNLRASGEASGVIISGLPERPSRTAIEFSIGLAISNGSTWIPLDEEIGRLESDIIRFEETPTASTDARAEASEESLYEMQRDLAESSARLSATMEELAEAVRRRESLDSRIEALEEDLQRHRDLNLLERLGSSHIRVLGEDNFCPTCHQELNDGVEISDSVMSVAENVQFIEQQLKTFRSMAQDITRVTLALRSREGALRDKVADLRRSIRANKLSLIEAGTSPSASDLVARLRAEDRREKLVRTRSELSKMSAQLGHLSVSWNTNEERIRALTTDVLSLDDQTKIHFLQEAIREQLRQYKFRSLPADTVDVSTDTYRPVHEGFDLGFDLSASDMIRLIWSYLIGLFETSAKLRGNHPRLLIFDEPRQQETARVSFEKLLERSARLNQHDSPAQVIFATSEDEQEIVRMLNTLPHTLLGFSAGEKIIQPI